MNWAKRTTLIVAATLAVAVPSATFAAVTLLPTHQVQNRVIFRGGVIRLGTSVYVHDNSAHASIGITRIALVGGCHLRVYTDWVPGEQIMAAIAEEDEAMAHLQVQSGITGGNAYSTIYLFRRGVPICANHSIFGRTSNIWLQLTYLGLPPATPTPSPKATPTPTPTPTPVATPTPAPVATPTPTPTPTATPVATPTPTPTPVAMPTPTTSTAEPPA